MLNNKTSCSEEMVDSESEVLSVGVAWLSFSLFLILFLCLSLSLPRAEVQHPRPRRLQALSERGSLADGVPHHRRAEQFQKKPLSQEKLS